MGACSLQDQHVGELDNLATGKGDGDTAEPVHEEPGVRSQARRVEVVMTVDDGATLRRELCPRRIGSEKQYAEARQCQA